MALKLGKIRTFKKGADLNSNLMRKVMHLVKIILPLLSLLKKKSSI